MRFYFTRYHRGQTPIGVFSNLWPSTVNRIDRQTIGVWYLAIHAWRWRWEFFGSC